MKPCCNETMKQPMVYCFLLIIQLLVLHEQPGSLTHVPASQGAESKKKLEEEKVGAGYATS